MASCAMVNVVGITPRVGIALDGARVVFSVVIEQLDNRVAV
jgi:hypothetical protein